jgi:CubicO group peptidase (beta-lactamase class C family)
MSRRTEPPPCTGHCVVMLVTGSAVICASFAVSGDASIAAFERDGCCCAAGARVLHRHPHICSWQAVATALCPLAAVPARAAEIPIDISGLVNEPWTFSRARRVLRKRLESFGYTDQMRITGLSIGLVGVLLPATAISQTLPAAGRPEELGFSSQRLERAHQRMQADMDGGGIPGAVLLIARQGKAAWVDAFGFQERKTKAPMRRDSIFRIASMSKPITSVAIMMLAEEGKLDIGAPVSQYLPEFKDMTVGVEKAALKRPITVQDLLRHTSGLTYGIFGNSSVDELYKKSGMFQSKSLAEMVRTIAGLPLAHQPGEFWEYSVSTDVLGRIVEVVSGMDLDAFVATRITGPLRMKDTGFYLTAGQAARFAHADTNIGSGADPTVKPAILSGGGGMLSTADDYARFCQMMLNGGALDGVRILAPKTVTLMTSDQLPPGTERHTSVAMLLEAFGPTPEMGTSFGLGFAVRTDAGRNPMPGSVGDFSWGGIYGTLFWVDPEEKLVAVLMTQAPRPVLGPFWRQTRTLVYQAMTR